MKNCFVFVNRDVLGAAWAIYFERKIKSIPSTDQRFLTSSDHSTLDNVDKQTQNDTLKFCSNNCAHLQDLKEALLSQDPAQIVNTLRI